MENNNNNINYPNNNYQPQQRVYYTPQQPPMPQQPPYMPAYSLPIKKEHRPFSKRDNVFVFLFLISTFIFVDFALFKGFHLGFSIAYFVMFIISTIFIWNKDFKPSAFSLACGAISLAGAATFALFGNYLVNAFMFILICGLFTLYCLGISGSFKRKQGSFKLLFDLGMGATIEPLENIGDVVGSIKASAGKGKKNISALIGVIIALPVLIVIVPLLVKSDAAFEGLINTIVKNIGMYLLELVVAAVLLPFIYSFMFGKKHRLNKLGGKGANNIERKLPISGCVSFLCVISLTYLVYLFSQLAYFFSAFKGILPEDYNGTKSEFARRGFFEMFAICAINIAIISLISAFAKRNSKGKNAAAIKVMSLFISLFSLLMLATAMQKMRINITTNGFTANRLLVSAFMIMMIFVIAFFIIHIFAPKVSYMQALIIICSCIFVALSFANIDAKTAEYNIKAYESGAMETLDLQVVANLGDSSIPYLIHLTQAEDKALAHKARVELSNKVYYDDEKHVKYIRSEAIDKRLVLVNSDFRSYCKSSDEAWNSLLSYYNSLDEDDEFNIILRMRYNDDGYYDEYEDVFYNYETNGKSYRFNEETNQYEEFEDEYEYDYDLDYDYDEGISKTGNFMLPVF